MRNKRYKYIIGIDEAGRGPLAGPVAIGAVLVINNFKSQKFLEGIKDSKKMSVKQREEWDQYFKFSAFVKTMADKQKLNFKFAVAFVGQKTIDKKGISFAVKLGIKRIIMKLEKEAGINSENCFIMLDGLLKAPAEYNQETVVKGDEKIPVISAASIIAKVARDKRMMNFHKKFPQYGFDRHKGYGTKLHYEKIRAHGLCPLHRRSYCKKMEFIKV